MTSSKRPAKPATQAPIATTAKPALPCCAVPRATTAAEICIVADACSDTKIHLQLAPRVSAVKAILDETFGTMGWCCRRYTCDGTLYCAVGVYSRSISTDFIFKDAPADYDHPRFKTPSGKAATSLINAAALWGVCADVLALPSISLSSDQVAISTVYAKDNKTVTGYKLGTKLTVDQLGRDASGNIVMVQFLTPEGKKALWEAR